MNLLHRSLLACAVVFPLLRAAAQDQTGLPASVRDSIRAELRRAQFAPVRPAGNPSTERAHLAAWRGWVERVLARPAVAGFAGKPYAAEATQFVKDALDLRYTRRSTDDAQPGLAVRARKLLADGCTDPLVQWLAVNSIASADGNESAARKLAEQAREAFRNSKASRVLGYFLYMQKAGVLGMAWEKERDEAMLKAASYLAESLQEPGTWTEADAPLYVSTINSAFSSDVCRAHKEVLEPLHHPKKFPEWAEQTLAGFWQVELGWEGRGDDWAVNVTEEGWLKFDEHLQKAAQFLTRGWELEPRQPYAAARMIPVAMAGKASESTRLWFDRTVAARIDYMPAWRSLLWAERPRWGGRVETMRAIALAAVECGRFDTDIPFFFVHAADATRQEIGPKTGGNVLTDPVMAAAFSAMAQGYAAAEPAAASHWAWWRAVAGWQSGRLAETRAALAETGTRPMPQALRWRIAYIQGDETAVRGEAALDAAGLHDTWKEAIAAHLDVDLSRELSLLDKLSAAPAAAAPLVARQRRIAETEQRLAAGEWVKLTPQPGLHDWLWMDGAWKVSEDGRATLTGDSNRALLVHRARIGGSFEARGTLHCSDPSSRKFCAGLVFVHRPMDSAYGRWITGEIIRKGEPILARVNRSWYSSNIPEKQITTDWSRPVPWTITLKEDRLTWTIAGGSVCQNQHLSGSEDKLGPHYRVTPNGRIGFCSRITPEGNTMLFSEIEVRRLP